MDDPAVIIKFFQNFSANFNNENYYSFVDIGSCSLHIVRRAFRIGAAKPQWTLNKVLNGAYMILYNTPATRKNYKSVKNFQPMLTVFSKCSIIGLDYHYYISKMYYCLFQVKRFLNYFDFSIIYAIYYL